jgi:uncharacterized cupredoxin-like copper-binding protein
VENRPHLSARHLLALAAALAAIGGVASACGGGVSATDAATVVHVTERDFAVAASPRRVPAGDVVFIADNHGPDAHELIVIRSSRRSLPLRSDGLTVDEEGLERVTVGALEPALPGRPRQLRARLKPGRYILLCNMAGHYLSGMETSLVVG